MNIKKSNSLKLFALALVTHLSTIALFADNLPVKVYEKVINKKSYCVVETDISAPTSDVWKIITNYSAASRVFPNLVECRLLNSQGNVKTVKHSVNPSGMPNKFSYVLEVTETTGRELSWHKISGDFKEVEGYWRLIPIQNGAGTHVVYASHVTGTLLQPEVLIKRQCKIDMPTSILALKNKAESSGTINTRIASTNSSTVK